MNGTTPLDAAQIRNPYWDAVKHLLYEPSSDPTMRIVYGNTPMLGGSFDNSIQAHQIRPAMVRKYAWSVTDPDSVAFVAKHTDGRVLDPLAGTGYWVYLLRQMGVKARASDEAPPRPALDTNRWHPDTGTFVTVYEADVERSISIANRLFTPYTLLLSWPPMGHDTAHRALSAYTGDKVIYIGEGKGAATADDAFYDQLNRDWRVIDAHLIVQWHGMHDLITVWTRKKPADPSA